MKNVYREGADARREGKAETDNPYTRRGERERWRDGWKRQDKIIKALEPKWPKPVVKELG